MNCYRCDGKLDPLRDTCPKCGTDVTYFKKIVYMSNRYYNDGLAKAEARDLTGAKESLKTSLALYKKNTDARNLLGLVYYATGESAEALKMWVISKNYEPGKNMCDRYMNYIRRNMNSLDSEDHGIKKFNQALNYAKNNARDLAVIQLKKVISVHPNMTKAYELLSLIYMEDGKYEQAEKVLNNCLKVDRGNTRALSYLKELQNLSEGSQSRSVGIAGEDDREQLIIPVRFRDFGSYLANALYILFGVLLGIAIAWYVIVPGRVEKKMQEASMEALSYESQISDLQKQIADQSRKESEQARVSSEEESESESQSISESQSESEEQSSIEEELESMPLIVKLKGYARNNETAQTAGGSNNPEGRSRLIRLFFSLDPELLSDENLYLYDVMARVLCNEGNREAFREEAEEHAENGRMAEAADLMDALTYLIPESPGIRLRAAELAEEAGDKVKAANLYWQYYWLFDWEEDRDAARDKYIELTGKEDIDPWPEELNKDEMTMPVVYEDLIAGLEIPDPPPTLPSETEEDTDEEGSSDEGGETEPEEEPGPDDTAPEEQPVESPAEPEAEPEAGPEAEPGE